MDIESKENAAVSFKSFFNWRNLKEGVSATIKRREFGKRGNIFLVILALELEVFMMRGKWQTVYLYLRRQLEFTLAQFSRLVTIFGVLGLVSQYVFVPLLSAKLKFRDSTIALMGE